MAAVTWRTEYAPALFALVEDGLHRMGRQVIKNRSDGHHRYSALIADRRGKLERNVTDRLVRHAPKHALLHTL
jgi:hypothetical protein